MIYVDMAALTWPEAAALADGRAVLGLVPLGAFEQHGPHLPLATDAVIAAELGRLVAERIVEPVVVAPVFPAGLSEHHIAFPGTVTVSADVFGGLLSACVAAFERMGIDEIAVFSAHGGNFPYLATWLAARTGGARVIAYSDLDTFIDVAFVGARRGGLEPNTSDSHAGAIETSELLASHPELVQRFDDVDGYVGETDGLFERVLREGFASVTATGVIGDPRPANALAGTAIYASLADHLTEWIVAALPFTRR